MFQAFFVLKLLIQKVCCHPNQIFFTDVTALDSDLSHATKPASNC
jgi:hypothetical protein